MVESARGGEGAAIGRHHGDREAERSGVEGPGGAGDRSEIDPHLDLAVSHSVHARSELDRAGHGQIAVLLLLAAAIIVAKAAAVVSAMASLEAVPAPLLGIDVQAGTNRADLDTPQPVIGDPINLVGDDHALIEIVDLPGDPGGVCQHTSACGVGKEEQRLQSGSVDGRTVVQNFHEVLIGPNIVALWIEVGHAS